MQWYAYACPESGAFFPWEISKCSNIKVFERHNAAFSNSIKNEAVFWFIFLRIYRALVGRKVNFSIRFGMRG